MHLCFYSGHLFHSYLRHIEYTYVSTHRKQFIIYNLTVVRPLRETPLFTYSLNIVGWSWGRSLKCNALNWRRFICTCTSSHINCVISQWVSNAMAINVPYPPPPTSNPPQKNILLKSKVFYLQCIFKLLSLCYY